MSCLAAIDPGVASGWVGQEPYCFLGPPCLWCWGQLPAIPWLNPVEARHGSQVSEAETPVAHRVLLIEGREAVPCYRPLHKSVCFDLSQLIGMPLFVCHLSCKMACVRCITSQYSILGSTQGRNSIQRFAIARGNFTSFFCCWHASSCHLNTSFQQNCMLLPLLWLLEVEGAGVGRGGTGDGKELCSLIFILVPSLREGLIFVSHSHSLFCYWYVGLS